ncbi:MAG: replication protein A [ANME-2 cluster archaeon]|nr:replication protein A [ANME-2 cluster archaeon]MBC2700282.1 replication protein A [ANME-2 cluster archaeon]MBC2708024.1 replication protein A [ANME-2 cluster archaeon]MBC2747798.1 replication protein A [ANME-2 cluster archaeon]MBC2762313.1 replication protein A [ANME-2 cluster archaeon]
MNKEIAKEIEELFSQKGYNVPINEIKSRLDKLLNEFKVPQEEARRSVVNYFLKEYNIPRGDFFVQQGETPTVKVSDITSDGKWINISAKVVQLWDNNHESIDQAGLMGDETGTIKFNKWAKAELPALEEGKTYLFKNVVTDSYQERPQINFNRTSQIEEIQEDIEVNTQQAEAPTVKVSDITTEGKWINISAKVAQLWDSTHESIDQAGLMGDETGTIKFIKWAKAELPSLVEGKSYLFKNVVTDSFQERFQINFNRTSLIEEITEDIEIGTLTVEFSGAMVDIQSGSGLIKRCPECNRALIKGVCGEHGKVEGSYDLRIKAVMDDGVSVQDSLLNREISEQLTGITLDEAKQMATEALDQSVVLEMFKEKLLGRYYLVKGPKLDRNILVEDISLLPPLELDQMDTIIAQMEV